MKKIRFAMVGLGGIAESFALSFHQDEAELYGCASRNFKKAQDFAEKFNIPHPYENYEALLADETIAAVYVAVPNLQHFAYCKQALLAGKHVLCEKAITTNLAELTELMALAAEKHLIIQEAMTIFNMPLYDTLTEKIQQQAFGPLKMVQAPFGSYKDPDPTNRFFNPDLGGGALLDIGTYAVSFMMQFLTATPQLIATKMIPFETGVDEASVSIFANEKQELATVSLSFQGKMPKVGIVTFENAYLTIADYPRGEACEITFNDGRKERLEIGNSQSALNYEVTNFIKVLNGAENLSLKKTKAVITLLDAMATAWKKEA